MHPTTAESSEDFHCIWKALKALEKSKNVTLTALPWLVQVGLDAVQQIDDGILNPDPGLVGELELLQVRPDHRPELPQDEFLQGLQWYVSVPPVGSPRKSCAAESLALERIVKSNIKRNLPQWSNISWMINLHSYLRSHLSCLTPRLVWCSAADLFHLLSLCTAHLIIDISFSSLFVKTSHLQTKDFFFFAFIKLMQPVALL